MPSALVLINCEDGTEDIVLREISQLHVIMNVVGTYGAYDIVAEIKTPDMETLEHAIKSEIQRIENIRSTITLLVIDHYSDEQYYDLS